MPGRRSFALVLLLLLVHPAQASRPDRALLVAADTCQAPALALLGRLVAIDSGTENADGVSAVGTLLAGEFARLGGEVRRVPGTVPGVADSLLAVFHGKGRGRILLVPHMDTVFARGVAAERPFAVKGERASGPGAGDDKDGAVAAVCALTALQAVHFTDFERITVLVNSNEETGSFGSRDLIQAQAREHDVALVLESGMDPDALKTRRKGSATITLEVTGRAAHAGVEPEKGRNALIEAAQQALRLGALANPALHTTVNATWMRAGTVSNVIPDHATVLADVRVEEPQELDRVERDLARQVAQPVGEGVVVTATLKRSFPPFPARASTDALVARARAIYAEIGRTLGAGPTGGAGDAGFVAATGTPVLDGLGFVGGAPHGPDDYVLVGSIGPRTYLLARLIEDLARRPPPRDAR
ncbi:MAG: M20 family metallopeptidase [Proteobacteria bacterium]|nr:M20 family metallopeptidase [Pseudomonadota bacterium]